MSLYFLCKSCDNRNAMKLAAWNMRPKEIDNLLYGCTSQLSSYWLVQEWKLEKRAKRKTSDIIPQSSSCFNELAMQADMSRQNSGLKGHIRVEGSEPSCHLDLTECPQKLMSMGCQFWWKACHTLGECKAVIHSWWHVLGLLLHRGWLHTLSFKYFVPGIRFRNLPKLFST